MFTCETIWKSVERANCTIIPYDVDTDFTPLIEFQENQFYLINNYFGITGKKNTMLCKNRKKGILFLTIRRRFIQNNMEPPVFTVRENFSDCLTGAFYARI